MKMIKSIKSIFKKLLLIMPILVGSTLYAAGRFGGTLDEIPRATYSTAESLGGVAIASVTSGHFTANFSSNPRSGTLYLRSITFSGVIPTTITLFDCQNFTVQPATRTQLYWPGGNIPAQDVNVSIHFSSAIMPLKAGAGVTTYHWDYLIAPIPYYSGISD